MKISDRLTVFLYALAIPPLGVALFRNVFSHQFRPSDLFVMLGAAALILVTRPKPIQESA